MDEPDIGLGEGEDGDYAGGTADPDTQRPDGEQQTNVVVVGDPSATATRGKNSVVGLKEKKIANDKRTTTPYMTKYERARVLGTRALQIRCGA